MHGRSGLPVRALVVSLSVLLCWEALPRAARAAEDTVDAGDPSSLEEVASALSRHERALARDPESFAAHLGIARALDVEMAIRTNGNLPLVDGLQDSDENRALWSDLGARALEHARKAHALRPGSTEAAGALAISYMFYASSLGIVRSILQGAGGEYRENAGRLIEMAPAYDDGTGDFLMASFYLVAPWPIGDGDSARSHFERAAELAPASVRNHYGLGVYWARQGDEARARAHFERSRDLPCTQGSERLFCEWMKQQSRRALDAL